MTKRRELSDDVAHELGLALAVQVPLLRRGAAAPRRSKVARSALTRNRAGEWRLRYDAGRDANGKRHRPTIVLGRLRDRRAAEAMARAFLAARRGKRAVLDVAAFARVYVDEALPRLKPGSAATSRSVIDAHIVPRFGPLLLHAVRDHVQAWIDEQAGAHVAPATIKTRVAVLRQVLAEAVRRGLIGAEHLPARAIWPRTAQLARAGSALTFTAAEQALVLGAARWPLKAIVALGFFVGLRPSETLGLTWQHLDLARAALSVEQQLQHGAAATLKTASSEAVITMPPELVAILAAFYRYTRRQALASGQSQPWLFARADGTPLTSAYVRTRLVYPLLDRLGLERRGLHACRHAFADRLLEAGTNLRVIQAAMRHATLEATEKYLSRASAPDVASAIAHAAREAGTAPKKRNWTRDI